MAASRWKATRPVVGAVRLSANQGRAYSAEEATRRMRSWTLPFLIRHSAYHTLDHTWEMEDKDLSAQDGA